MTDAHSAPSRIAVIDVIRTFSILAVLAVHLDGSHLVNAGPDSVFSRFAHNGSLGVTAFFTVSGFIITETILRCEPDLSRLSRRRFYVKRAGRLLPLAVVLLLGTAVLSAVLQPSDARDFVFRNPHAHLDGWLALSFPSFTFNWLRVARSNASFGFGLNWDVFWSLAIEEQFYLLFPLLLRRYGTGSRLHRVLISMVLIGPLFRATAGLVAPRNFLLGFTATPAALDQLALGVFACLFSRRLAAREAWWAPVIATAGVVVIAATWWNCDIVASPLDRTWAESAIALGIVAVLIGGTRMRALDRLPSVLTRPGECSYGLYLLHGTCLFLLWPYLSRFSPWVALGILAGLSMVVAGLSHRFIERPLDTAIRSRIFRGPRSVERSLARARS